MVKHFKSIGWPVDWLHWWMGDGALRCSLNLSPKVLPDILCIVLDNLYEGNLSWYISLLFWYMLSLSWGTMSRVHIVLFPLKCTCMPKLLQVFLYFLLSPLMYGTIMNMFLFPDPMLLMLLCSPLLTVCRLFVLCLWLNLICSLLRVWG